MTKHKPLNILAVTGGVFTSVMYASYFIKLLVTPEGALPMCATVIVLALVLVPLIFHKLFARVLGRAYRVLKIIYAAVTCFYLISFTAMSIFVLSFAQSPPPASELTQNDVIIVFGCRAYDYGPGKALKRRLDKAYEVAAAAPQTLCVVSGGQGSDESVTEASAMEKYLLEKGVPAAQLMQENKARNTRENIDNSIALLDAAGIGHETVACVSSRFHLARISLMCRKAGINAVYYPSDDEPSQLISMLVREYMSFVHYFILGY